MCYVQFIDHILRGQNIFYETPYTNKYFAAG